jgi:hypothetical protein
MLEDAIATTLASLYLSRDPNPFLRAADVKRTMRRGDHGQPYDASLWTEMITGWAYRMMLTKKILLTNGYVFCFNEDDQTQRFRFSPTSLSL